jgi:hypothetical protein
LLRNADGLPVGCVSEFGQVKTLGGSPDDFGLELFPTFDVARVMSNWISLGLNTNCPTKRIRKKSAKNGRSTEEQVASKTIRKAMLRTVNQPSSRKFGAWADELEESRFDELEESRFAAVSARVSDTSAKVQQKRDDQFLTRTRQDQAGWNMESEEQTDDGI